MKYDSCSFPMFLRMRADVKDQAESMAISLYAGPADLTYGSDQDMGREPTSTTSLVGCSRHSH